MGTWAIPDTEKKIAKVKKAIGILKKLKDELYDVYGDDDFMDRLDQAIDKLEKEIPKFVDELRKRK